MSLVRSLCGVPLIVLVALFSSCKLSRSNPLVAIKVVPSTASVSVIGDTAQFKAIGTFQDGTTNDLSSQVSWQSSDTTVAMVDASGLAKSEGPGSASITASKGTISATATFDSNPPILTALTIIPAPGIQTLYALNQTAQFLAIGTFSGNPTTQDMTDQVTWISHDVDVATVNSTGLATALTCTAPSPPCKIAITASATNSAGATITATSDLSVFNNPGSSQLPSLAVYEVGQGSGTVVSSPVGINCGSGASCTANFPLNSTVTLTATPVAGSVFIGWSANCNGGTNLTNAVCSVPMQNNQTVGAIFALNPTP